MPLSRETLLRIAQTLSRYSYDEECKELAEQVLNELIPISEDNLTVALSSLLVDPLAFRLAMAIALGDQGQTNAPIELADPDDAESFGPFHFDNNPKWIGRKVELRDGGILTIRHVDDTWCGEAGDEPICLKDDTWCHEDGRYYYNAGDHECDIVRLLAKGA